MPLNNCIPSKIDDSENLSDFNRYATPSCRVDLESEPKTDILRPIHKPVNVSKSKSLLKCFAYSTNNSAPSTEPVISNASSTSVTSNLLWNVPNHKPLKPETYSNSNIGNSQYQDKKRCPTSPQSTINFDSSRTTKNTTIATPVKNRGKPISSPKIRIGKHSGQRPGNIQLIARPQNPIFRFPCQGDVNVTDTIIDGQQSLSNISNDIIPPNDKTSYCLLSDINKGLDDSIEKKEFIHTKNLPSLITHYRSEDYDKNDKNDSKYESTKDLSRINAPLLESSLSTPSPSPSPVKKKLKHFKAIHSSKRNSESIILLTSSGEMDEINSDFYSCHNSSNSNAMEIRKAQHLFYSNFSTVQSPLDCSISFESEQNKGNGECFQMHNNDSPISTTSGSDTEDDNPPAQNTNKFNPTETVKDTFACTETIAISPRTGSDYRALIDNLKIHHPDENAMTQVLKTFELSQEHNDIESNLEKCTFESSSNEGALPEFTPTSLCISPRTPNNLKRRRLLTAPTISRQKSSDSIDDSSFSSPQSKRQRPNTLSPINDCGSIKKEQIKISTRLKSPFNSPSPLLNERDNVNLSADSASNTFNFQKPYTSGINRDQHSSEENVKEVTDQLSSCLSFSKSRYTSSSTNQVQMTSLRDIQNKIKPANKLKSFNSLSSMSAALHNENTDDITELSKSNNPDFRQVGINIENLNEPLKEEFVKPFLLYNDYQQDESTKNNTENQAQPCFIPFNSMHIHDVQKQSKPEASNPKKTDFFLGYRYNFSSLISTPFSDDTQKPLDMEIDRNSIHLSLQSRNLPLSQSNFGNFPCCPNENRRNLLCNNAESIALFDTLSANLNKVGLLPPTIEPDLKVEDMIKKKENSINSSYVNYQPKPEPLLNPCINPPLLVPEDPSEVKASIVVKDKANNINQLAGNFTDYKKTPLGNRQIMESDKRHARVKTNANVVLSKPANNIIPKPSQAIISRISKHGPMAQKSKVVSHIRVGLSRRYCPETPLHGYLKDKTNLKKPDDNQ